MSNWHEVVRLFFFLLILIKTTQISPGVSFTLWSYKFHTVLVGIEFAQPVIGKDLNSGLKLYSLM